MAGSSKPALSERLPQCATGSHPGRTIEAANASNLWQSRDVRARFRVELALMAARLLLFRHAMSEGPRFDVSVILPFGDDEEAVGIAVRRTAEHLRASA